MNPASPPSNELERLAALRALDVLESEPEPGFDALVRIAIEVIGVPMAVVALVDADRLSFKASHGLDGLGEIQRGLGFCDFTLLGDGLFEVPDAAADARFARHPIVLGPPHVRFYAGLPIKLYDGSAVGVVAVADRRPRELNPQQRLVLQQLAVDAGHALEARRALRDRHRAMSVLAASEARYRAITDALPLGVMYCDAEGACTYVNPRWQEACGLPAELALGRGWLRALHPDDLTTAEAAWSALASAGAELDTELRVVRPDGQLRTLRTLARALTAEGGAIAGIVATFTDITHRRRDRERLRESEERLRRLYEQTPAMLSSIDAQGRLVSVSDQWLANLGYRREEVLGREPSEFMTPESRAYLKQVVLPDFFRSGRADRVHYQMLTRDGEVRDVQVSTILERNPDGTPLRSMAVMEDITERLRTEQALQLERQRLEHIIAGTQAGTWEWNLQTGETRHNERWAEMLGMRVEELPTHIEGWAQSLHPDDLAASLDAVRRHIKGEVPHHETEVRVRHRDGHWIWILSRGQVKTWTPDGRAEWMYGFFLDITERKEHEETLRKARDLLNRMGEVAAIGGWSYDLLTGEIEWSDVTCAIHGEPPGFRPTYEQAMHFLAPAPRSQLARALERARAGATFDLELPLRRADGTDIWVRAVGAPELDEQGRPVRLVGALQDITEARRMKQELAEQHELLRVTLESIGDGVITTDADGHVMWLNPVAERMTGWPGAEARGQTLAQVFQIYDQATGMPVRDPVLACLEQGGRSASASSLLLVNRAGGEYGVEHSVSPIRNAQDDVLGAVLVFRDVTEQRRLAEEMSWRATHDPLTGLINRSEFEHRLEALLASAQEDGSQHALLYVDLDDFKLVNDACGHAIGDTMLQQVGKLFAGCVRARDTVARLGGDEFGVILEQCPVEKAQRVAQQICDRMEDFRFHHEGRRFRIGASIGLVPIDRRWSGSDAILQAADTSCYAAKSAGRNRTHVWFDTDLAMRARQGEMHWASRIEQALDEDRFVLHAQRLLPLAPGNAGVHAEVLLRMLDHDGKLVPPGAFLPAAERFHLAPRIDRWVLRRAVEWMKSLPDPRGLGTLCINVSGQSISDRAFHRHAIDILADAGPLLCGRICLEITETATVTNLADASEFMQQVRTLGVQVALDDFGAGASSFGYLKALPVDALKIDGQFIRDIIDDPLDEAAVRCFVDVARVVGVKTVAEFVDRPEVLAKVREIGIDYAQGFLVHRPEPIERLMVTPLARVG